MLRPELVWPSETICNLLGLWRNYLQSTRAHNDDISKGFKRPVG